MAILIDGYNLLHVTGIFGKGIGPGTLERSRGALLNFLAAALDQRQCSQTTVVFDAKDAPPGLPSRVQHKGLTVLYAAGYEDADTLLEELIRDDSAPKRLVVVSSDHRVQRAARRRRAEAVDSGPWYAELVRRCRSRRPTSGVEPDETKPPAPLSQREVQWWLRQFGDVFEEEEVASEKTTAQREESLPTGGEEQSCNEHGDDDEDGNYEDLGNPFPPGYGEDLLQDDE